MSEKYARIAKFVGSRYIVLILRLVIGGVFLVSSIGKLADIERYSVDAVYNFGILPMVLARPFGLVMPFVELACALGLLLGVLTRLSALGAGLMSIAFFAAKAIVLAQGREIECGCFGAIVETLASFTIYMDIPMVIFYAALLVAPARSRHWIACGRLLPEQLKERLCLIW